MAKILLCFSSTIIVNGEFQYVSYYEGLINELKKNNNTVMACNTAEFLKKSWSCDNELSALVDEKRLRTDVEAFDPDLVISFNNSKLPFIDELCHCPIVIWEADSFTYYNDKAKIESDPNRYLYFCLSEDVAKQLRALGANDCNVFSIKSGTAVAKSDVEFKSNISFIGTNFKGPKGLSGLLKENNSQEVRGAIKYLADNFYVDPEQYLKSCNMGFVLDYLSVNDFGSIKSCQNRINTLAALSELGLSLYGGTNWLETASHSPLLALSFISKPVFSLKHNQDIYNSSRLCLNVSHAQAVDGFPWRIMDVMASNGCLLTSYNAGIASFTKGYVELPMYESSSEAYDLAKRLLSDSEYRKELVLASQACIEEKGRWKHRFKEITEATGVSLLNSTEEGSSKVIYIKRENYMSIVASQYGQVIMMAGRLIPSRLHPFLYNLVRRLGVKVDYQLVRSVSENNNV